MSLATESLKRLGLPEHLELVDLCGTANPRDHHLFAEEIDRIAAMDFPLRDNYLDIDLAEYLSFPVLIDSLKQRVVAFSGLQWGRWQSDLARAASRLWVNPEYRRSDGWPADWNSRYLMPYQLAICPMDRIGACFWSREEISDRGMQFALQRANENCPFGFRHQALPGRYYVCPTRRGGRYLGVNEHGACWQKIALVCWELSFRLLLPHQRDEGSRESSLQNL